MSTRYTWMLGLSVVGLALTAPVQASTDGRDGSFMLARNDTSDSVRQEPRDEKKAPRSKQPEAERTDPAGYGYGYERRQHQDQADSKDRPPRQPRN